MVTARLPLVLSFLLFSLLPAVAPTLAAQASERSAELRGFGGWSYGRTNRNHYRQATEEGNSLNVNLALNVTAQVSRRLTIVGQVEAVETGDEETELELDFAFAQWDFSDE